MTAVGRKLFIVGENFWRSSWSDNGQCQIKVVKRNHRGFDAFLECLHGGFLAKGRDLCTRISLDLEAKNM